MVISESGGMESRLVGWPVVKGEGRGHVCIYSNSTTVETMATCYRFLICKMGIVPFLRVWERIK